MPIAILKLAVQSYVNKRVKFEFVEWFPSVQNELIHQHILIFSHNILFDL